MVMSFPGLPFPVLNNSSPEQGAGSAPWPSGSSLQLHGAAAGLRHLLRNDPESIWALLKAEETSSAIAVAMK